MTGVSRRSFSMGIAALSGFGLAATRSAGAQNWPARPVTIVLPFAAGGGSDGLARAIAAELSEKIGGRFIVENRSGAGGNIGAASVAKAEPDGYTLLLATNGPGAVNKLIYKDLQYDPERDFAPVVLLSEIPVIIAASAQAPFKTLAELISYAKANPASLTVGSPGNGTLGHITGVLLQHRTGIKLNHVPYRGSAPLTSDLLGGQINLAVDFMATYAPLIADRRLQGLAISGDTRNDAIPDVPTVKQAGYPDLDAKGWCALLAPAQIPAAIVEKINAAANTYINSDKGKAQLKTLSMTPAGGTPGQLKDYIAAEIAKWKPVIKEANISI